MITIHKYQISLKDHQVVEMPKGAEIVYAGFDPYKLLCVWARVDTRNPIKPVNIYAAGTGHSLEGDAACAKHISTITFDQFVWHFFYRWL